MTERLKAFRMTHIDIRYMFSMCLRQIWMVVLAAIMCAMIAGTVMTLFYPDTIRAQVVVAVNNRSTDSDIYDTNMTASSLAYAYAELLDSKLIQDRAARAAGYDSFDGELSVKQEPNSNLIQISLVSATAKKAYTLLEALEGSYKNLSSYIDDDYIVSRINSPTISTVSGATVSRILAMVIAGVFGAGLMFLYLILHILSQGVIQTEIAARDLLDARMLVGIGHEKVRGKNRNIQITSPTVSFSFLESVQQLCSQIDQKQEKLRNHTMMICSVVEHEGKSTMAENIALAMLQRRDAVLIIDADFRKPSRFRENSPRTNAESGQWIFKQDISVGQYQLRLAKHKDGKLYALYSDKSDDLSGLLSSQIFGKLMEQMEEMFSFIVIDTPPLSLFSDAEQLAQYAASSLLVVRQGYSTVTGVNDSIDILRESDTELLGFVFNDVHAGITVNSSGYAKGGYYGKGYGYGKYGQYGKYGSYDKKTEQEAHHAE